MILKILLVLMSLTSFTQLTILDYSQLGSTVSDVRSGVDPEIVLNYADSWGWLARRARPFFCRSPWEKERV